MTNRHSGRISTNDIVLAGLGAATATMSNVNVEIRPQIRPKISVKTEGAPTVSPQFSEGKSPLSTPRIRAGITLSTVVAKLVLQHLHCKCARGATDRIDPDY